MHGIEVYAGQKECFWDDGGRCAYLAKTIPPILRSSRRNHQTTVPASIACIGSKALARPCPRKVYEKNGKNSEMVSF